MNITKKDIVYLVIIVCLLIGWVNAVITQQNAINNMKHLYNHLVQECNEIIEVQDKKDFCITLPNGETTCNQKDLNIFIQSLG